MFILNQLFRGQLRLGLMLILLLVLGLGAVPGETWALLNDTIRLEAQAIASFTEKKVIWFELFDCCYQFQDLSAFMVCRGLELTKALF